MKSLINIAFISTCFILSLTNKVAYCQEKYLVKAKKEIDKGNFEDVPDLLSKYKEKSVITPEYQYILSLFKEKKAMGLYEYEEAYSLLKEAYKGFLTYPEEVKKDFCKSFDYCDVSCVERISMLEKIIFERYKLAHSIEKMDEFILKYPDCEFFSESVEYRDSLAYSSAENSNTIESFNRFIEKYPDSKLIYEARDHIHSIAYSETRSINTIEAYEQFLKKYPKSLQAEDAKQKIIELEYSNVIIKNSVVDYENFLKKYPNNKYQKEIKGYLENLDWREAQKSNSIIGYQNFILKYPSSTHKKEAETIIEDLKKIALPYLLSSRKYKFYDIEKNTFVSDEEYDEATILKNGDFVVQKNKLYGLVNRKGIKVIPCKYECIKSCEDNYIVGIQNKYGLLNRNGEIKIDIILDGLINGDYGYLITGKKTLDGNNQLSGLIDFNNNIILDNLYDYIELIDSTHAILRKGESFYVYNIKDKTIGKSYESMSRNNNCLIVGIDNNYGIINLDGTKITEIIYSNIYKINENFYCASDENKTILIDKNGNTIYESQSSSSEFEMINNNILSIINYEESENSQIKIKLYNIKDKKIVSSTSYDFVSSFGNNSIYTEKGNNIQIIDENGSLLFGYTSENTDYELGEDGCDGEGEDQTNYFDCDGYFENQDYNSDEIFTYANGEFLNNLACIRVKNKYGYLNKSYEIALPLKYSYATNFENGLAIVSSNFEDDYDNNRCDIIDSTGKIVLKNFTAIKYSPAKDFVLVKSENELGKLYLSDFHYEAYENGITNIDFFNGFNGIKYKDIYYFSINNKNLRDKDFDFTAFEASAIKLTGIKYFNSQDYYNAIDYLKDAIEAYNNDAEAFYYLAKSYLGIFDYSNAKKQISKAIELQPNNSFYILDRIEICKKDGDYEQIINDCDRLLELKYYDKGLIYFTKGYYESENGQYEESINSYSKAINLKYSEANSYNNRGSNYSRLNRNQEALNDYKKAISMSTKSSKEDIALYYSNCGLAYYNLKKKSEACAMLKKSLNYSNTYVSNYNKYCK